MRSSRRSRPPGLTAAALALVAGALGATATHAPRSEASGAGGKAPDARWIVQLRAPPLAAGRTSPAAAQALQSIEASQAALAARLGHDVPTSGVERRYAVTLNGLAVRMSGADAAAVATWPEVLAVTPDIPYHLDTFSTPAQIGATDGWRRAGGQAHAGEGVKIAVIDSGIYATRNPDGTYGGNACFDDTGYLPLPGYPRGDSRFTNNKVIVAKAFFRPDAPPEPGEETALPGPGGSGHGTHVAATAACDGATAARTWAGVVPISGVAPRARLMSYRVFYPNTHPEEDFGDGNAYTVELVAAIEEAVRDGADVIVGSWGSSYRGTLGWPDPMVRAVEGAADAGVVVVMADGNDGPEPGTGNSPALSPKVLAVGAVTRTAVLAQGPNGSSTPGITPVGGNVMAAFSARGPGPDGNLKPDLVAPGVDVLSAGLGGGGYLGFGFATGTSMAAPHVAGAAALVRQLHPDFTPGQVRSALMTTADQAVYLDDPHGQAAGPLDRGAGLVDVGAAAVPLLTLDPPSLSGGLVRPGSDIGVAVNARDAGGGDGRWDAVVTLAPGTAAGLSAVMPAVPVRKGESTSFTVTVHVPAGTPPGDVQGTLTLTNQAAGRSLHLPLWFSVNRDPSDDVLLLDDDGSSPGGPLADYGPRYEQVLDRLGHSHRTVDLETAEVPRIGALRGYRMALLFTGDRSGPGIDGDEQNRLSRWLDEGGRLWVAGQNTAEALDDTPTRSPALGRSRLYHGFLGLAFVTGRIWEGPAPARTLKGAGVFAGLTVDLSPGPGTAAQASVEGARPIGDTDSYAAMPTTVALFAPERAAGRPAWAGFARSSEPRPGEARQEFRYRAVWTGFGLEGVNPSPGSATPDDVARRAVDWLLAPTAAPAP